MRKNPRGGIRGAFRELVKQYHPDRVGPAGTKRFREIIEAYEHLSDPALRHRYNDAIRAESERAAPPRARPEPLVPEGASVFASRERVRPSPAPLFERIRRNFGGEALRGEPEALNLEVVLPPEEAVFGGMAPIWLPVFRTCPRCEGSGHDWLFPCRYCLQRGFIESERTIRVRIPPMMRDGSILQLSMASVGIHNLFLSLHIRIL